MRLDEGAMMKAALILCQGHGGRSGLFGLDESRFRMLSWAQRGVIAPVTSKILVGKTNQELHPN
jgi:hypothetical protein